MIMTIDPGSSGCAWAIWRSLQKNETPFLIGKFKPRTKDWMQNACHAARAIDADAITNRVSTIYCEEPKFFNEGAANDGALVKLSFAVGCIGMAADRWRIPFKLVPVSKWMGQINEQILIRRVTRILGESVCTQLGLHTHAWDAVGIGLYLQGRF